MTDDIELSTLEDWARETVREILTATRPPAIGDPDAGVWMIYAARAVLLLLREMETQGRKYIVGYPGNGWMAIISEYAADRVAGRVWKPGEREDE